MGTGTGTHSLCGGEGQGEVTPAVLGLQAAIVKGVGEEAVDEGAEGHAAAPAPREVLDVHVLCGWVSGEERGGGIRTLLALCQPPVPQYSPGSHVSWHGTTPAAWLSLSPWPPHASGVGLGLWLPCGQASVPHWCVSPRGLPLGSAILSARVPLNVPPLPHAPSCPMSHFSCCPLAFPFPHALQPPHCPYSSTASRCPLASPLSSSHPDLPRPHSPPKLLQDGAASMCPAAHSWPTHSCHPGGHPAPWPHCRHTTGNRGMVAVNRDRATTVDITYENWVWGCQQQGRATGQPWCWLLFCSHLSLPPEPSVLPAAGESRGVSRTRGGTQHRATLLGQP